MKTYKDYLIDFDTLKVGQEVWSPLYGQGEVSEIKKDTLHSYPIFIKFDEREDDEEFTENGLHINDQIMPMLFKEKPDFFKEKKEVKMSDTITITKDRLKDIMRECFDYGELDNVSKGFSHEDFPPRRTIINNFFEIIIRKIESEKQQKEQEDFSDCEKDAYRYIDPHDYMMGNVCFKVDGGYFEAGCLSKIKPKKRYWIWYVEVCRDCYNKLILYINKILKQIPETKTSRISFIEINKNFSQEDRFLEMQKKYRRRMGYI